MIDSKRMEIMHYGTGGKGGIYIPRGFYLCLKSSKNYKKGNYYLHKELYNYNNKIYNEWSYNQKFKKKFKWVCHEDKLNLYIALERDRQIDEILN